MIMLMLEYVSIEKRSLVGNLSLAISLTVGGTYQPWLLKGPSIKDVPKIFWGF